MIPTDRADAETGLALFAGPASERLGREVCERLHIAPAKFEVRRFPDGEIQIEILESGAWT